jgi:hypothetical protein
MKNNSMLNHRILKPSLMISYPNSGVGVGDFFNDSGKDFKSLKRQLHFTKQNKYELNNTYIK